jgi:hypothetical protein
MISGGAVQRMWYSGWTDTLIFTRFILPSLGQQQQKVYIPVYQQVLAFFNEKKKLTQRSFWL